MKCNLNQKRLIMNRKEARKHWCDEGKRADALINLGMFLACLACANKYGFGAKRIHDITVEVNRIIHSYTDGTKRQSDERSDAVYQVMWNVKQELEQICKIWNEYHPKDKKYIDINFREIYPE